MERKMIFRLYIQKFVAGIDIFNTPKSYFSIKKRYIDRHFNSVKKTKITYIDDDGVCQKEHLDIASMIKKSYNLDTDLYRYIEENYPEALV